MDSPSDTELQILYAGENEAEARAALGEMLRRNDAKLRGKALRLCSFDRTDADDLYGETALRLCAKRSRYVPGPAPWIAWAIRVMCGCASDRRKKKKAKGASRTRTGDGWEESIPGKEALPERALFNEELDKDVAACLDELKKRNPERQQVFLMHFYEEQTFERVTESLQLGQGPTPAKHRYDKAIKQLGACLRAKGYGLDDLVDRR